MNGAQADGLAELAGIRVVELAGAGPVPFAAMLLAQRGAHVVRVCRPGADAAGPDPALGLDPAHDPLLRGRAAVIEADLKSDEGLARVRDLCATADVFIEGLRPGVAERLGLGPAALQAAQPRLVYARVTGWGQRGPLAPLAAHDINILAATGVLACMAGSDGRSAPPLNLVADFGAGGMQCVVGILAALLARERTGRGRVVDVSMAHGVGTLMAGVLGVHASPGGPGVGVLAGQAPWYRTYATADGRELALGCVEPKFFAGLLALLELPAELAASQYERGAWAVLRERIAQRIRMRTLAQWRAALQGRDICVTPVLTVREVACLFDAADAPLYAQSLR